jgi:RNA polymerase sigma factor (TIGR02999 family)
LVPTVPKGRDVHDLRHRSAGNGPPAKTAPRAVDRLLPLVYDELRRLAGRCLRNEGADHLLQPTALVHEAYVRLAGAQGIDWQGKTHLLAVAATEMRRILVEQARSAGAAKRGSRPRRISLDEGLLTTSGRIEELLSLDESLRRLADMSPRQARVAEMRLFAGMLVQEIAGAMGVSERTVKADWQVARAWLARDLRNDDGHS